MIESVGGGANQIEKVLDTTMSRLKTMMDNHTVFGEAYKLSDGTTVIPVSRVTVGYVAGGGEYNETARRSEDYPFAGGSGACVAMTPIGFLVGAGQDMKLIPMEGESTVEKVMDLTMDIMEKWKKK